MTTETRLAFVVLRDQDDADGTRHLEAEWRMGGAIVIEGRDVGPGVERFWGDDHYAWEWVDRRRGHPRDDRRARGHAG